jgi:hypothetical protein
MDELRLKREQLRRWLGFGPPVQHCNLDKLQHSESASGVGVLGFESREVEAGACSLVVAFLSPISSSCSPPSSCGMQVQAYTCHVMNLAPLLPAGLFTLNCLI